MVNCTKCNKSIGTARNKKGFKCSHCDDVYHSLCGQISDAIIKEIEQGTTDWRCSSCRSSSNRRSIVNLGNERSTSVSSFRADDEISNDSTRLSATFNQLTANLKTLNESQQMCMASLADMNKQIAELQLISSTVSKHETRIKSLEDENKFMKTSIKALTARLDNFEQKSNTNRLQFSRIPPSSNENLSDIISKLCSKLNVTLANEDIQDIFRLSITNKPKKPSANNIDSSGSTSTGLVDGVADAPAPDNPIIVNFKSRSTKDKILVAYRNIPNHTFFLDNLNTQRIYVFEYLSSNRRRLFYKTKLFCKANNYKYLWTKNGNIFVRKEDGSKRISINCHTDFAGIENDEVEQASSG